MEWESAPVSPFDDPLPKVEPEEDPLGGDVLEDVTVPSPEHVTVPSVPAPQTATPGVKIVDLENLLQNPAKNVPKSPSDAQETESNPCQPSKVTVPGVNVLNDTPVDTSQNSVVSATGQPQTNKTPATHNLKEKASNQLAASSASQNVPNSTVELGIIKYDPELQVKHEPEDLPMTSEPEETTIEDELSELLKLNKRTTKNSSQAVQPISVPGKHLATIPGSNITFSLSTVQSANFQPVTPKSPEVAVSQTADVLTSTQTVPSSKRRAAASTTPSSFLPGSNVVVLLTQDGRLIASPVTLQNVGCNSSKTKSQTMTSNNQVESVSTPRTINASKSSTINASKSTTVTTLNNQTPKISNASKLAASTSKPKQYMHMGKVIRANAPNVKPSVTSSSSLWPPPSWTRRKQKPKIDLPLSGSWTNPNPPSVPSREEICRGEPAVDLTQPETDPLEGPVREIVPYFSQSAYHHPYGISQKEPLPVKCSTSTQCSIVAPALLEDLASETEPAELKRPFVRPIKRGVGVSVQSKLILYNIFKYFEQRKAYYNLDYTPSEVAESATGVNINTLRNVMREAKKSCNTDDPKSVPTFKAPCKRKARVKTVISNIHFDSALRRYIHEHLLKKKEAPSLRLLKRKCQLDGWKKGQAGQNFIRLRVKKLGFVSVRTSRRMITIEGAPIRAWRYKYLKQMETCVEKKSHIVFTFVVNLRQVRQSSTDWEVLDACDEVKEESRVLTVFHAANENGFIGGAFFINDTNADPNSAGESILIEKSYSEWLELHVLKKIPEGSAVVLAHSKYHHMADCELKPNAGCSKKEVVDWLKSHVVGDVDETLPKCVLLEDVSKIPVKQKYTIDSLVETYGQTPMHLPPFHRDLNPIEYVWEDFRAKVVVNGKLKTVKESLAGEFSSAEPTLHRAWKQVRNCEENYRKIDPLVDDAQEAAIRKLGGFWNSPSNGPLPDETGETLDVDLNSDDSDSSDSDSSGQSNKGSGKSAPGSDSGSPSDSDSDSDSDSSEGGESDESDSSESTSSDSEDSQDGIPLSESVNGNKRRKME